METIHPQKQRVEFLTILQQAFQLTYRSPRSVVFAFLSSLPLVYTMLVYQTILKETLVSSSNILNQTPILSHFYAYTLPFPIITNDIFTQDIYLNLLTTAFLYRVPLFVSEMLMIVVTVVLTSSSYNRTKPVTRFEIIVQTFMETRFDHAAITAFYVHAFKCCMQLGFVSLVASYYFVNGNGFVGYFCYVFGFFLAVFGLVLLKMYLEWEAEWNMAIVVSILEGEYGAQALGKSAYLGKENERCGFMLMLVFFILGLVLRSSTMFFGWYGGMMVQVGLFCVGNVMKWVVCTVYYSDCEAWVVEKRLDEEEGENVDDAKSQKIHEQVERRQIIGAGEVYTGNSLQEKVDEHNTKALKNIHKYMMKCNNSQSNLL